MEKLKEMLGEELFKQVIEKLGDTKLMIDDGNQIPKSRLDEVIKQKKERETQLDETQQKIKELEPLVKDNKELSEKVKKLNDDIDTSKVEYDGKVQKMDFDHRLDSDIRKAGATSESTVKAIRANLDISRISLDGENFIGLDNQVKQLKENEPLWFGKPVNKGNTPPAGDGAQTGPIDGSGANEDGTFGKGRYKTKTEWAELDGADYGANRAKMGLK